MEPQHATCTGFIRGVALLLRGPGQAGGSAGRWRTDCAFSTLLLCEWRVMGPCPCLIVPLCRLSTVGSVHLVNINFFIVHEGDPWAVQHLHACCWDLTLVQGESFLMHMTNSHSSELEMPHARPCMVWRDPAPVPIGSPQHCTRCGISRATHHSSCAFDKIGYQLLVEVPVQCSFELASMFHSVLLDVRAVHGCSGIFRFWFRKCHAPSASDDNLQAPLKLYHCVATLS